jgi:hypothetical protein
MGKELKGHDNPHLRAKADGFPVSAIFGINYKK